MSRLSVLLARLVFGASIFGCVTTSHAATYYVAPNGDDGADGSEATPLASAARAQALASPGDTIYFRAGVYAFTGTTDEIGVLFDKSGEPGAPIRYFAYPGERPVFDFFELLPQARVRGFSVRASWLHFKGLELRGVQQILTDVNESWCIRVENGASNNVFEALDLHHNEGPGLFIADGGDNLVLNVDSHHNWDPDRGGENSDGFGCHSNDAGNVFRGCRAWYNSDDGYDFINSPGQCAVEYSVAAYNGYQPDSETAAGNGSGFKAGGFGLDTSTFPAVVPRHQVRFNLAFKNRSAGFYANHHPGGIDWFNNTAFDNPRNFDMLADVGAADHFLRNNLAVAPGSALAQATAAEIDDASNSWSLGVDVSEADFVNLVADEALAPRNADGSLPDFGFLHLATGSDLIDAGQDTGSEYEGAAPDLGAFELGGTFAPSPTEPEEDPSGGEPGSGGQSSNPGNGGASGEGEGGSNQGGESGENPSGGSQSGGSQNNGGQGGDASNDPGPASGGSSNPGAAPTGTQPAPAATPPFPAPTAPNPTQPQSAPTASNAPTSPSATGSGPATSPEPEASNGSNAAATSSDGCTCRVIRQPSSSQGSWLEPNLVWHLAWLIPLGARRWRRRSVDAARERST